jgi:hypothetical protein
MIDLPGRVAQWESARLTRERSLVRTQPRPSDFPFRAKNKGVVLTPFRNWLYARIATTSDSLAPAIYASRRINSNPICAAGPSNLRVPRAESSIKTTPGSSPGKSWSRLALTRLRLQAARQVRSSVPLEQLSGLR